MIKIFLITAVLLLNLSKTSFAKPIRFTAKSKAIITKLKGNIKTKKNSKWVNLNKNSIIEVDQPIKTAIGSMAELKFSDGSILRIKENTEIMLCNNKKNNGNLINFIKGRIWANIIKKKKPSFAINAQTAIVAVLGTRFDISTKFDKTIVKVINGEVGVIKYKKYKFNNILESARMFFNSNKEIAREQVSKPFHQVKKPIKEIKGPKEISKDKWMKLIANEQLIIDNKGNVTISKFNNHDIDDWINLNKDLDN